MSSMAEKGRSELGVAPLNFIYACSLCSASFADIYEGHNETVQGLSDGINPKERLVTRLFLASCCHVFCSSHLEGGGPPFHSEKERPKAPCPVCVKEKGASEPQFLYSIRGFSKNQYDPVIPPSWFTAPPIRLDGSGPEMDALRFQYIALLRYCQNTYAMRKPLEQAFKESEKKLTTMRNLASEEHARVLDLQKDKERLQVQRDQFEAMKAEVQRLQRLEQEFEQFRNLNVNSRDLETFVKNKSAIRHYLKLVPMLIEQNEKMRKRLAQLGFAMPLQPVPNFKEVDPSVFGSDEALPGNGNVNGDSAGTLPKTASNYSVSRSLNTPGRAGTVLSSIHAQRPVKRKRLDPSLPVDMQAGQFSGQRAMPPPSKPLSRLQSVRSMIPSLRKKFTSDQSSSTMDEMRDDSGDVRTCDTRRWHSANAAQQQAHNEFHRESPYMSGALPVEQPSEPSNSRSPRLPADIGVYGNQSGFTFRASSPVKEDAHNNEQCPVQLPHKSSYLHLMDSLSHDNDIELELKDPRESPRSNYQGDDRNRQVTHTCQKHPGLQGADGRERWNFEHHSIHQWPYKSSVSSGICRNPLQYGPTNMSTNRNPDRANVGHATSTLGDSTLTPERHHRLGSPIESVVSPYFKSGHRQARVYSPSGLAEPEDSSSRSVVYPSQIPMRRKPPTTWPQPSGLNGLSFFDFPVSPTNKPGELVRSSRLARPEPVSSSRHHHGHYLDSSGFIRRPKIDVSQHWKGGAYVHGQSHTSYAREPPGYSRTVANAFPPKIFPCNRIGEVLSTVPSVNSTRSSAHSQSQWKKLQRAGVRSSQNGFVGDGLGVSSQHMFSASGRRIILR